MFGKVKCMYGEKGLIRWIPEKLANNFEYMRRHNLHRMEVPEIAPIKVEKLPDNIVLDIKKEEDFEPEVISEEIAVESKEELWKLLDEKGITYKKTMGVEKLKQLLNS